MIRQLDFGFESHGNKSFITYRVTDRDRMDSVEMEMMRKNNIEGLLPFNMMQSDEQIICCYDITSMANLSFAFQKKLNRQQLLQILEKIAQSMENAEDYMLDSSHFVLNPEYIYTTLGELDIQMMLIPCLSDDITDQIDMNEFLRSLISGISFDYSQGGGEFYAQVLNYINSGQKVTPRGLRENLYQFMGEAKSKKQAVMPQTAEEKGEAPSSSGNDGEFFQRERSLGSRAVKQEEPQKQVFHQLQKEPQKGSLNQLPRKQKEKVKKGFLKKEKKQMKSVPDPGIEIPEMVITGKDDMGIKISDNYSDVLKQSEQNGKKKIAMSPAEAKRKKHSLFHKKEEKADGNVGDSLHVNGPIPKAMPGSSVLQEISDPNHQMPVGAMVNKSQVVTPQQNFAVKKNHDAEANQTGQYAAAGEIAGTVMIENTGEEKPFLENAKTGERIYLTKESFRLGRHPDYVDFVVENSTVGRIHAAIVQREGHYYVMDINSKNGTFVNTISNRIPSNVEVEIADGCQVWLGTEHYYFYTR